ncbi:MAG: histidine kinase [Saprospiraceae bacterium]|nr:histidine kinase [Saprospiraceae bacterium]
MKKHFYTWFFILIFLCIGKVGIGQKNTDYLDSLKSSLHTTPDDNIGQTYFKIARQYLEYQPNPDSFQLYINLSAKQAKKHEELDLLFNYYYYKGVSAYRSSQLEIASKLLDSAKNVSQYTNDSLNIAKMFFAKGIICSEFGDEKGFHENLINALESAQSLKNLNLQTSCLIVLSQKAKELRAFDQQNELLNDAYQLYDQLHIRTQLKVLTEMGAYHADEFKRKKKDENLSMALNFVNRGIKLADSIGNKVLLMDLWMKSLQIKDASKQIDQDYLNLAQQLLDSAEKLRDPFFIFKGHIFKGIAYTALNQPEKTIQLEDKLLDLAKILKGPAFYRETYDILKNAASASNRNILALDYYDKFIFFSDSLKSLEKAQVFTDAIQKYEREKKEKQILLLSKKKQEIEFEAAQKEARFKQNMLWTLLIFITILGIIGWFYTRQKNKLTKIEFESFQNEQKLLRSQMNPHFLFNSLNSIKRFYIEGRIEEANDFMADFGNLLRQILEQSSKPFISIEEELEFLSLYLELEKRRFKKKLNYTIEFEKDDFDFDDQIPSLILQPLVENSIWHGIMKTDRDGEISIKVEKVNDEIKCTVSDNGIGYHSSQKTKNHSYTSKGLQLVKDRIGHNGYFKIQSIFDSNGLAQGTLATLIVKPNIG